MKLASGSLAKNPQRANPREPRPRAGKPRRPAHITGLAATKWNQVIRVLDEMDVLSTADADLIELYC